MFKRLPTELTASQVYQKRISSLNRVEARAWKKLANCYLDARHSVKPLLEAIPLDLPDYTDHSIRHVDALWTVLDQIIDDSFEVNPAEIFVIGCCFLLHDAAQSRASYQDFVSDFRNQSLSSNEIEFIRLNHARKVKDLVKEPIGGKRAPRFVFSDPEFRSEFGSLIAEICESHWWSSSELGSRYSELLPENAPVSIIPECPASWTINKLKVASLLRIADIAHCDARRAPLSQYSIRANMHPESVVHWEKQSKIRAPRRYQSKLIYNSRAPYEREAAQTWWASFDMLKEVDREIKSTNSLLEICRFTQQLSVQGVADIETPEVASQQTLPAQDWVPTDLRFRLDDVSELVRTLGGTSLYGSANLVPLRELLQNAAQASLMWSTIVGEEPKAIEVRLEKSQDQSASENSFFGRIECYELQVSDYGIGMSLEDLKSGLLAINKSHWTKSTAANDFASRSQDLLADQIARFGIGFLSVFMWSDNIKITTQSEGSTEVNKLHFSGGLRTPPILDRGSREYRSHGTDVRIGSFRRDKWVRGATFHDNTNPIDLAYLKESIRYIYPFPEIDILLQFCGEDGKIEKVNWKNDWKEWETFSSSKIPYFFSQSLPYTDRPAVVKPSRDHSAVVVWQGFRVGTAKGWHGIVEAEPISARRDDEYDLDQVICRDPNFQDWLKENEDHEWGPEFIRVKEWSTSEPSTKEKSVYCRKSGVLSIDELSHSTGRLPIFFEISIPHIPTEDLKTSINSSEWNDAIKSEDCKCIMIDEKFDHYYSGVLASYFRNISMPSELARKLQKKEFWEEFILNTVAGFSEADLECIKDMRRFGVKFSMNGFLLGVDLFDRSTRE